LRTAIGDLKMRTTSSLYRTTDVREPEDAAVISVAFMR